MYQFLHTSIRWVLRHRLLVLIAFAALTLSAFYAITQLLGMNTDTEDMLSAELPWRRAYIEYKQEFPQYIDNIIVVIDAPTPDQADSAAVDLSTALAQETELIESALYLPGLAFFRDNQFLFLDLDELEDLADQLAAAQPFLGRMAKEPTAAAYFTLLAEALKANTDGEIDDAAIDIEHALTVTNDALTTLATDAPRRMSWQNLIGGEGGDTRAFVQIKPITDFSSLSPGDDAITLVRATLRELGITSKAGYTARLTGTVALATEELASVTKGAARAGISALVMVVVVLLIGLGSAQLALVIAATLIVGLILTAGFAAIAIGELNLISIAFAVLYVGLGVDFAIHLCLRYREALDDSPPLEALTQAGARVGESLVLCAITTAIGFLAFVPTSYTGIAELGIIAGVGMFIGLIVSLTVLPIFLLSLPAPPRALRASRVSRLQRYVATIPTDHPKVVLAVTAIATIIALASLRSLEFDPDPLNLHDQSTESITTFRELIATNEYSPLSAIVLAPSADDAQSGIRALTDLDAVNEVVSAFSFVPSDQEEKLFIVDDLRLSMGDLQLRHEAGSAARSSDPSELRDAISNLLVELGRTASIDSPLRDTLAAILPNVHGDRAQQVVTLDDILIGNFESQLSRLRQGLNAASVALDDLPPELSRMWVSSNGAYRIEAFPAEALDSDQPMRAFVSKIRATIGPEVIGLPVIMSKLRTPSSVHSNKHFSRRLSRSPWCYT